jgi:excisionase family DNA binding protein
MIDELYHRYLELTGEPQAAAMLVLAHSNLSGGSGTVEEFLTVPEAAERLRVSANRVYELVRDKRLPSFRAGRGGAIRIKASDLGKIEEPKTASPEPDLYVPTPLPERRPRGRPRTKPALKLA